MAQATIPVRTQEHWPRDEGQLIQLDYDTPVIVATGLPGIDHIEIRACRVEFRPGKGPSQYEIRYAKDLKREFYRFLEPRRKERRRSGWGTRTRLAQEKTEELSPDAGKVITRVTPLQLHRVPIGAAVFFQQKDTWTSGRVEDYVHAGETRRAQEKSKAKADAKKRQRARYPSVWDRLNSDD